MTAMTLLFFFTISAALAQTPVPVGLKRACDPAPVPTPSRSLAELTPILEANNVEILSGNTVQPGNVESFLAEYNKMPESLRTEMISRRAGIRIMEGSGIGIDSSMTATHTTEDLDGDGQGDRDWMFVPGGGGFVNQYHNIPTRLAINNLYNTHGGHGHGATNLVLHEHAHTLDSIYGDHALSSSAPFRRLLRETPRSAEFLNMLCTGGYCAQDKPIEAFAELFAYYHNCERTRSHMEEIAPEFATFFRDLTSARGLLNGTIPSYAPPTAFTQNGEYRAPPAATSDEEDCDTSPTADFTKAITPLTNVNEKLKQKYIPTGNSSYQSGSSSVSAGGMK